VAVLSVTTLADIEQFAHSYTACRKAESLADLFLSVVLHVCLVLGLLQVTSVGDTSQASTQWSAGVHKRIGLTQQQTAMGCAAVQDLDTVYLARLALAAVTAPAPASAASRGPALEWRSAQLWARKTAHLEVGC
jgi:hypothetical protein